MSMERLLQAEAPSILLDECELRSKELHTR